MPDTAPGLAPPKLNRKQMVQEARELSQKIHTALLTPSFDVAVDSQTGLDAQRLAKLVHDLWKAGRG